MSEPGRYTVQFEIADVGFTVEWKSEKIQKPLPFFESFLVPISDNAPRINVRIETGGIVNAKKPKKIFQCGESWALYGDGGCFRIESGESSEKYWAAMVNRDFTEASVFLNDSLAFEHGVNILSNPVYYTLGQIFLMHILAREKGALVHSAGIEAKGAGLVFPGKSGAGKSTLSRLFLDSGKFRTLSDDRIAIRKINGNFKTFGTPWPGDAEIAENASSPLSGIFFLTHGDSNKIVEISKSRAFEKLLPVVSIPWYDGELVEMMLGFCEELATEIPAFELQFEPSAEAVDCIGKFLGLFKKYGE